MKSDKKHNITVCDINQLVRDLGPEVRYDILFIHALLGCYTTSKRMLANIEQAKEAGLVGGFRIFYAMNELSFGLTDELRKHYKIDTEFMERHAPRFETLTGLKFATAMEWFEWIQSNKDRLILSSDGKHVVVR